MILYGKIINKETGLCEVGIGTNIEFYKSIGYVEIDVKQSDIDNAYYLSEKCPMKTEQDLVNQRQVEFEKEFIQTLWGWYRKLPKGYSNAPQSIDIIYNMVNKFGSFTEQMSTIMIFYQEPDFTKAEQCTEEWLIANQITHQPCTKEEFEEFYYDFQYKWALEQHK